MELEGGSKKDFERVLAEDFEKTQLGTFFYLLYLQDLFKDDPNVCVMISDLTPLIRKSKELENDLITTSSLSFKEKHPTFAPYYNSFIRNKMEDSPEIFRLGLLYAIISVAGPYLLIVNGQSYLSKSFRILLDRCKNSGARYTVSLANITSGEFSHASILILDNKQRTIERWDPSGHSSIEGPMGNSIRVLDRVLFALGKDINYHYLSPMDFCPRIGIQQIESQFRGRIGFCLSWSIIYAEERLHSDLSKEDVAKNLLQIIMEKYDLTNAEEIEDWLNERIDQIFSHMSQSYTQLSAALGKQIKYSFGKLVY